MAVMSLVVMYLGGSATARPRANHNAVAGGGGLALAMG
jgi:hypothetical protein